MTHLNHIKIRNTRRFGESVDIDFGKGATIILAPNGTGKTTVFEAIELALTGKVDRVSQPPYALIRDLQTELDIQLTFDNDLICKANCQMGKNLQLSGDHLKLFGDKIDSLPYLLRLTHLLEQHGKDWFVSSDENDAGSKLDKLSIGRELNYILSKKQSASTALTKEQSRLGEKLAKSKEYLEEFNKQLEQKNKLVLNIELVPLPEIVYRLKTVSSSAQFTINANTEGTVHSVIAFYEQTKSALNQNINDSLQKGNQYSELDSLIQLYSDNLLTLATRIKENDSKNIILSQKEDSYNINQTILDPANSQLQDQQDALLKLKDLRNFFSERDLIINEIVKITAEIKDLKETQKEVRNRLIAVEETLEKGNRVFDSHDLVNADIEKNEIEKLQITKLEKLQKQWEEVSLNTKEIQEEVMRFLLNLIFGLCPFQKLPFS